MSPHSWLQRSHGGIKLLKHCRRPQTLQPQEQTKGFTQHTLPASCCLQLQAKTDEGFVKGAFRLCRDHLGVRTVLTPAQFLEQVMHGSMETAASGTLKCIGNEWCVPVEYAATAYT